MERTIGASGRSRTPAAALGMALAALVLALAPACRGSASDAGCVAPCCGVAPGAPSPCAAGNECISDGAVVACRVSCSVAPDGSGGQAACPFDAHCTNTGSLAVSDGGTAPIAYCAADKSQLAQKSTGQWGYPCAPSGGMDDNSACDTSQGFKCYGQTPTDASAFCTIYDCATDADCRGGYGCATIDVGPNVVLTTRTYGQTRRVCLPRAFCDPCASDVDCPLLGNRPQHCVPDQNGKTFCTPECQSTSNCPNEATCKAVDAGQPSVCFPLAQVCVGDGSLCAPCRSDADCPNGVCITSAYSTERSCSVASKTPCMLTGANQMLVDDCPPLMLATMTAAQVTCEVRADSTTAPGNQCFGFVALGTGVQPGCYTPAR